MSVGEKVSVENNRGRQDAALEKDQIESDFSSVVSAGAWGKGEKEVALNTPKAFRRKIVFEGEKEKKKNKAKGTKRGRKSNFEKLAEVDVGNSPATMASWRQNDKKGGEKGEGMESEREESSSPNSNEGESKKRKMEEGGIVEMLKKMQEDSNRRIERLGKKLDVGLEGVKGEIKEEIGEIKGMWKEWEEQWRQEKRMMWEKLEVMEKECQEEVKKVREEVGQCRERVKEMEKG